MAKGVSGLFQLSIVTERFDESLRFYVEGIGARVVIEWRQATIGSRTVPARGALVSVGSSNHIELIEPFGPVPAEPKAHPLDHFGLATDDCAASYRRALAAGGKTRMMMPDWDGSPLDVAFDNGRMKARVAFLEGPSGELVEFVQVIAAIPTSGETK